jgi:hypothetical protein
MSQEEQGRHCGVCCKTVIDFTAMPTEKVIEIISGKKDDHICGRFRPDQLHERGNEIKAPRNRYRIFMAALYFVFGGMLFTSCRTKQPTHKMGKVKLENSYARENNFRNNLDTPSSRTRYKVDRAQKSVPVCTKPAISATDTIEPQIMMLGEPLFIPADTTKK